MDNQISNIFKTALGYIHRLSKIRKYFSQSDTGKLVQAFTTSRLDCCNNSSFVGLQRMP